MMIVEVFAILCPENIQNPKSISKPEMASLTSILLVAAVCQVVRRLLNPNTGAVVEHLNLNPVRSSHL